MSRYDDDHVIALLRETVPAVPEAPDRMAAVRARAGRQRAMLWTQTLGAVASVLLVVGVAAAVTTPGGSGDLSPTSEPIEALIDALRDESSVRFEATMRLADYDIDVPGATDEQIRAAMESKVTGAATRDGDVELEGDLSFFNMAMLGAHSNERSEMRFRYVDGAMYRSPMAFDDMPPGKKWVLEESEEAPVEFRQLEKQLRLADAILQDVRYVGRSTSRGTRVAEYEATIPARYANGEAITLRFALDGQHRLRSLAATFSWARVTGLDESSMIFHDEVGVGVATPLSPLTTASPGTAPPPPVKPPRPTASPSPRPMDPLNVRVQVELFGYGDDIDITKPPAAEVVRGAELYDSYEDEYSSGYDELQQCLDDAESHDEQRVCYEAAEKSGAGGWTEYGSRGECTTAPDGGTRCDLATVAPPPPSGRRPASPVSPAPTAEASPRP